MISCAKGIGRKRDRKKINLASVARHLVFDGFIFWIISDEY